jgi:hypothetical protein
MAAIVIVAIGTSTMTATHAQGQLSRRPAVTAASRQRRGQAHQIGGGVFA